MTEDETQSSEVKRSNRIDEFPTLSNTKGYMRDERCAPIKR